MIFASQGIFWPCPETFFSCHNWDSAIGIWQVKARGVVKHTTMDKIAHTTTNYLASNVSNAKIEEL